MSDVDLADDLTAWLGYDDGDPDPTVQRTPAPVPDPTDLVWASRILHRLGSCERRAERVRVVAAAERQRLDDWQEERLDMIHKETQRISRRLEGWMRAHHEVTGDQSTNLPSGVIRLRKGTVRVTTAAEVDEALAAALMEHDPELVRIKREIAKSRVSKVAKPGPQWGPVDADGFAPHVPVTADGETLPGAMFLVPSQLGFSYQVAKGES